jgi:hypothetical protein
MSAFDPEYVFSHHHASPEQLQHFEAIHAGAKHFAKVVLDHVPDCPDRDARKGKLGARTLSR